MIISSRSYLQQYGFWGLVVSSLVIYGRFFVPLIAIVAIIELPPFLLHDVLTYLFPHNAILLGLSQLLLFGAAFFGTYAIIAVISDICLGNEISIARSVQRLTARSVFQLLGTSLLSFGIPFLPFMALVVAGVFLLSAGDSGGTWLSISGVVAILLGVLVFFYLVVRNIFAEQIVILERKYWFQALRRSAEVVRKSWWRIAFFWLLWLLIMYLPLFLIMTGPRLIAVLMKLRESLVLDFYETLTSILFTPLFAVFGTLFYYSERIRKHDLTAQELVDIKTFEAA